jgi:hypothetical protein
VEDKIAALRRLEGHVSEMEGEQAKLLEETATAMSQAAAAEERVYYIRKPTHIL